MKINHFNKIKSKKSIFILIFFVLIISFLYTLFYRNDIVYAVKEHFNSKDEIKFSSKSFENDFEVLDFESEKIHFNNNLILVNKSYSVEDIEISSNLTTYKGTGLIVDHNLVDSLENLIFESNNETGEKLFIMSSFRNSKEQEELYLNDKNHAQKPNHSEHETGLALDFYTSFLAGRNILKSDSGKFIYKNSYKYGFILRYPLFKKHITGINYEPWHLRYVGAPHAEIMYKKDLTLEEYIKKLKKKDYYIFENFYISHQNKEETGKIKILENVKNIAVSPDNTGGFIITGKISSIN